MERKKSSFRANPSIKNRKPNARRMPIAKMRRSRFARLKACALPMKRLPIQSILAKASPAPKVRVIAAFA